MRILSAIVLLAVERLSRRRNGKLRYHVEMAEWIARNPGIQIVSMYPDSGMARAVLVEEGPMEPGCFGSYAAVAEDRGIVRVVDRVLMGVLVHELAHSTDPKIMDDDPGLPYFGQPTEFRAHTLAWAAQAWALQQDPFAVITEEIARRGFDQDPIWRKRRDAYFRETYELLNREHLCTLEPTTVEEWRGVRVGDTAAALRDGELRDYQIQAIVRGPSGDTATVFAANDSEETEFDFSPLRGEWLTRELDEDFQRVPVVHVGKFRK